MTRSTSSIVVSASSTFRRPSSNIVIMPFRRASARSASMSKRSAADDLFYGIGHLEHFENAEPSDIARHIAHRASFAAIQYLWSGDGLSVRNAKFLLLLIR